MTSLVAVREALKSADSEHAALFTTAMEKGKLAPYKSKEFARQKLGSKEAVYSSLGKKQVPKGLRKRFSLDDLQKLCLRELPDMREFYGDRLTCFTRPNTANASMKIRQTDACIQTVDALTNPNVDGTATAVTFPSETLDSLCDEGWEPPNNSVQCSMTTCTILPSKTYLPLHHSNEGTTVTTLLVGSIVWIIWPPIKSNHRSLQTMYENLARGHEMDIDFTSDLEGGMIFVQTEGDGLRIPPHSLMMALATSTSVLATYSDVDVENFISMLHKLPLWRAWHQTELNGDRKQSEFNATVLRILDLLLNGSPDGKDIEDPETMLFDHLRLSRAKGGLLDTLFRTWDHVKNDLAAMMGPADHKTMEDIWESFLDEIVNRECRICGRQIYNKEKPMRKHFIENHWSTFQEAKRETSKGLLAEGREDASAM